MSFDQATSEKIRANRANWDSRTPVHLASRFYGVDDPARRAEDWFGPFEWDDLGPLANRDLIHLQCHLGTETVAFARKGARTVGLDFSGESISAANRIAEQEGVDVDYVHADVYDAARALAGRKFDIVYTGKGAVCYLPDLHLWAGVISDLLRPGGLVYIVEFHPVLQSLSPKPNPDDGPELLMRYDYLEGRGAIERKSAFTYTDGPALQHATRAYEWSHGLGEVVTALVDAGLTITRLRETELLPWPRWERMIPDESGWWRLPPTDPRIPLLYGLTATK
jgi:SAM-dependent methyltransferase